MPFCARCCQWFILFLFLFGGLRAAHGSSLPSRRRQTGAQTRQRQKAETGRQRLFLSLRRACKRAFTSRARSDHQNLRDERRRAENAPFLPACVTFNPPAAIQIFICIPDFFPTPQRHGGSRKRRGDERACASECNQCCGLVRGCAHSSDIYQHQPWKNSIRMMVLLIALEILLFWAAPPDQSP